MSPAAECAVVVGATGTVGGALVRRFAERGLQVVAVARDVSTLAGADGVIAVAADIGDNTAIELIRDALPGPVRIAVLAAGLPVRGSVAAIDPDLLAVGAQVKMAGVLRLWRAVREAMVPGSRFCAIAGTLGLEPRSGEAGPGAINAGLVNLMKQIAYHHGPDGITVHTLAPGPMDTPRLRRIAADIAAESGQDPDEVWAQYAAEVPLGRLPQVDELVWATESLLAPEAAALHGTVLHLDGGALRGLH